MPGEDGYSMGPYGPVVDQISSRVWAIVTTDGDYVIAAFWGEGGYGESRANEWIAQQGRNDCRVQEYVARVAPVPSEEKSRRDLPTYDLRTGK